MKKFIIIMQNANGILDFMTIKCNKINDYTLMREKSKILVDDEIEINFDKVILTIDEMPNSWKEILDCKFPGKDLNWICSMARTLNYKYVALNNIVYKTDTGMKICNANEIEE